MDLPNLPACPPASDAGRDLYRIDESGVRVKDMPERIRPREEFVRLGGRALSDDALLAIVLRNGSAGVNVMNLAQALLRHYKTLTALAAAPLAELQRFKGVGEVKSVTLCAALELGRRLHEESLPAKRQIRAPEDAAALLRDRARGLDREVFWAFYLDAKNHVKSGPVEISAGLLDASLVHPREVFKEAVRIGAGSVVVGHNHPSGDPTPSAEDIRITRQLVAAGRVMDIKVLDHVIMGQGGENGCDFLSCRERGLVEFG